MTSPPGVLEAGARLGKADGAYRHRCTRRTKTTKIAMHSPKNSIVWTKNVLYQLVMVEIGDRRNNEFCLGYQPNLHSPQGAKNNGIGARSDAVEPLPNRPNTSRICSRSASTLPTEAA
jgi:hypothetical protein